MISIFNWGRYYLPSKVKFKSLSPFNTFEKKKKEKLTKLNYKVFDRHHTLIPNVLTNQTQGPHFVS